MTMPDGAEALQLDALTGEVARLEGELAKTTTDLADQYGRLVAVEGQRDRARAALRSARYDATAYKDRTETLLQANAALREQLAAQEAQIARYEATILRHGQAIDE